MCQAQQNPACYGNFRSSHFICFDSQDLPLLPVYAQVLIFKISPGIFSWERAPARLCPTLEIVHNICVDKRLQASSV